MKHVRTQLLFGLAAIVLPLSAQAQDTGRAGDRDRQRLAQVDFSAIPALGRTIALNLRNVSMGVALETIAQKAALQLTYSRELLPKNQKISLATRRIEVDDALQAVLRDAGLDIMALSSGQVVVVRKTGGVNAQGGLAGRITDAKTGTAVTGVEVLLEKTRWRATTDTAGRYRLVDVDTGTYMLTARRLGYAKQSRQVTVLEGQTDTVDLSFKSQAARLQELVTTATGRRRRLDIANDVTTIKADSVMRTAPIRSLTDLLEHRVPGLTVQRTSGAPGDPARLRLRGASSALRSNDPIVVVDGIRIYSQQSAARNDNLASLASSAAAGRYAAPSPIDYIDPNTIETIEVLKGPSAATLHGADAANGVIIITTKKGRPGPARWTGTFEHGRTGVAGKYPELLYRAGHYLDQNVSTNCPVGDLSNGSPCKGDSLVTFQLLNDPALTVLDRGRRNSLSLGVSGGSQALTYSVIGTYADETGYVRLPSYEADRYQALLGIAPPLWMQRPQGFTRWGVTSTVGARLGGSADIMLGTGLSRLMQRRSSLESQLGTLMSTYLDRTTGTYYRSLSGGIQPVSNNVLNDYYVRATAAATNFRSSLELNWRPRSWLTTVARVGLDIQQRADQVFVPRGPANTIRPNHPGPDTTGYVSDGQGTSMESTVELLASADRPIGRGFRFRFAVGANYKGTSTNDVTGASSGLAPGSSLQGTEILSLGRAEQSDAIFGWYAEPSIGNPKFNLTTGLRLDGGSSYGGGITGFNLPKFPRLGFTYVISEEPWFPLSGLFQSFRVRVAYGRASRQPGPKDRLRLYNVPTQVPLGGEDRTTIDLLSLGNTQVRPEQSTELDGGFDADFLDRFTFSVSATRKTTDDALMLVPVASSVYGGNVSITKNIGQTRNTELIMSLGVLLVQSDLITWSTQINFDQRRDVVVRLGNGVVPYYSYRNPENTSSGGLRVAPGYPLDGRWSRPIAGYADENLDGLLQLSEIQLGDTAVYVGSTLPNFIGSLYTTVSLWRGAVDVTVGLSHEDGLSQRNGVAQRLSVFSAGAQVPGTPLAEQAAAINLATPGGIAETDYNWIQTVNTTRLNSVSVRYRVPTVVARRLGAQNLSVALQGSNLGLWTNYRGLDPNVNAFGTGNNVTDTGILPQPRTWQLQVNVTY